MVKPGRVMFELAGVNESPAREAMGRAQHKLPSRRSSSRGRGCDGWRARLPSCELTDEQLERAEAAKEELFNLRFQLATGQLDDSSMIKKLRHDVARIATVMRERTIEEVAIAVVEETPAEEES